MMAPGDKPLVWLHGEIKTPPFSPTARLEAGVLLGKLQAGERLGLPHSRPMAVIGPRCHELRIPDATANWRIVYRLDRDAVLIVEVFSKRTATTSQHVIEVCQQRLRGFDEAAEEEERWKSGSSGDWRREAGELVRLLSSSGSRRKRQRSSR